MKELFDAIYDKFVADGGYGLTALYNTEADEDATYPYATFSLVSATTVLSSFSDDWEDTLVQFNLYDDDPKSTDINAACKLLVAAFHKFDLVVVDSDTVSMLKEVGLLLREDKIWNWNVSFRTILQ